MKLNKKAFWFAISIVNSLCTILLLIITSIYYQSFNINPIHQLILYGNITFWLFGLIISIPFFISILCTYKSWIIYSKRTSK